MADLFVFTLVPCFLLLVLDFIWISTSTSTSTSHLRPRPARLYIWTYLWVISNMDKKPFNHFTSLHAIPPGLSSRRSVDLMRPTWVWLWLWLADRPTCCHFHDLATFNLTTPTSPSTPNIPPLPAHTSSTRSPSPTEVGTAGRSHGKNCKSAPARIRPLSWLHA